MERIKVISSHLNSIGHDKNKNLLEVEFYDGKIFQYHPVPREVYLTILNSDSVGSDFARLVRNNKAIKFKEM